MRQINSLQRLHDDTSHIDNFELQHYRGDRRSTDSKGKKDHTKPLGLDQIMVTKDVDVERL